jgi:hypothetical protein
VEKEVVGLMDHYARSKLSVPPDAPSPLRGVTSVALGGVRRNNSG